MTDTQEKEEKTQLSRYERVKQILNEAQGREVPNYQGYKAFWQLPIEDFLKVEIYGIRMIAPADEGPHCGDFIPETCGESAQETESNSCACCEPPAGKVAVKKRYPGRGAASGLIIGLKGEFPFDDSHFPRLPWGGKIVEPLNIQYIQDWIDDGCPEDDHDQAVEAQKPTNQALGLAVYPVSTRPTNIYKHEAGELKQRKNIEYLSAEELLKFRCAVYELQKLNKYPLDKRSFNAWGRLHGDECQHGWEQFLTWHRIFLYEFEQALQDIIPDVTIPYWDWTMPIYNQGRIPKDWTKQQKEQASCLKRRSLKPISGIIPTAHQCWLDEQAFGVLKKEGVPDKLSQIIGVKFNSGTEFFMVVKYLIGEEATQKFRSPIIDQLERVNPLWYKFRYPGMFYDSKTHKPIGERGLRSQFHHHYPTAADIKQILQVDNWRTFGGGPEYDQSFGVLDMDPHNTIHIWSGGVNPNFDPDQPDQNDPNQPNFYEPQFGDMLSNLTAGYDPIFWPHHANVDRIWARWQESHPGLGPEDPDAALAGLHMSVRDSASIHRLGYEYVATSHIFETDQEVGIAKLNSDQAEVHPHILKNHRKAEVRLHQVLQPTRSFAIRVFLNLPNANVNTPSVDNDHYVGYIAFFGHGDCIGGPGHCDPPPRTIRPFDRRGRHHNTPGNHRLDATETIRKLAKKGETDLNVNLVVIDPNGREVTEHLRLDAVSLNFMD